MIGVGATLNGRFTLVKQLGQGGMGTVFRATDQLLGRDVAVKLLKDAGTEAEARQIRLEAQILARLVHDRIVRLYDFGESGGDSFLVMEEVNGPSFANRWRDLPLDDRLRVCGQVAEALDYAHLQGVIHRDVKPGNVLLTPSDEAKLSDFGLSFVSGDRRDPSGAIWGTPGYMSPEQGRGKTLDHRTDLYSVGVMVYECATGDVPFVGRVMDVIGQHINVAPLPPRLKNSEIGPTLDRLILSLLEKNPAKRPASGSLVAIALFEEAERARNERINPGPGRAGPRSPDDRPPSSTQTYHRDAGPTPVNGPGRVDPGSLMISAPDAPARTPFESSRAGRTSDRGPYSHADARGMLEQVLATPVVLSPEERYLCGHYLAYLLGGPRRRGIFLRRPLDARNSDRARLMLAMAWLSCVEPTDEAIGRAGELLDDRPDVRAALSPVVVIKYLAGRDTAARRTRFRQVRRRLQEASGYASEAMLDANGVLNPGLMPRTLDDLATIAPKRDAVDAHRVSLWNRVAEVWRREDDFRRAVLRYATRSDELDTGGADLWPEVVYPLIERAHWQRKFRPRFEALWDYVVGKLLHIPVPGVRLDRMMIVAIPLEVAAQLNEDLDAFVDDPRLDEDEDGAVPAEGRKADARRPFWVGSTIPREEVPSDDDAPRVKVMIPLSPAEPFLFAQGRLRDLWNEAMDAQGEAPRPVVHHRTVPVGPYELAVIPTRRGRSAVRAELQCMSQGKQIEIITPLAPPKDSASRTAIAIWIYRDASIAVAHLDFQFHERYILWDAPNAHQYNYGSVVELRLRLSAMSLEVPDRLDRILSPT